MGKASSNEQIKLRAVFYNNVAVALVVAGFLLPYLTFFSRAGDMEKWISEVWNGVATVSDFEIKRIIGTLAGFGAALYGAHFFRKLATSTLESLED